MLNERLGASRLLGMVANKGFDVGPIFDRNKGIAYGVVQQRAKILRAHMGVPTVEQTFNHAEIHQCWRDANRFDQQGLELSIRFEEVRQGPNQFVRVLVGEALKKTEDCPIDLLGDQLRRQRAIY